MTSNPTVEPIRPPRAAPRRRRCGCGRKALFVSHARRSRRRPYTEGSHSLCDTCFRRALDALRAR